MEHSKKLILNTFALSIKIVLTCIVQLIATRIALLALGQEAFGLYNLLAGVIVLFTFLTGSLLISTQRYMSIAIGEKDEDKLHKVFNVSILIHTLFSIAIVILLLLVKEPLLNTLLNINEAYIDTAKTMYDILILSIAVTIITVPYSANINAREDMIFFAISEIASLLLKLWAAISLLIIKGNLLLIYTLFMFIAIIVGALMKVIWCRIKYAESKIVIGMMKDKCLFKEMIGFVSWNTLGTAAVTTRNQGVAVLLNIFYGTTINAAYGIANQVNSLVLSFATTLTTVFTPSIVQHRGAGNNDKMLETAILSSKLSFGISSIIALPLLVYLDNILAIWLEHVPEYTETFVFWIVLAFLIQQLYPGINRAIYAVGNIKMYQITTSIILISILPIGYFLLNKGFNVVYILITIFVLQSLCLFSTIYYAHKECKLNRKDFYINSVIKPCLLFSSQLLIYLYIDKIAVNTNQLIIVVGSSALYMIIYGWSYLKFVLNRTEYNTLMKVLNKFINK